MSAPNLLAIVTTAGQAAWMDDTTTPGVGEHRVYRLRDSSASEQVEVLELSQRGRKQRATIRFGDCQTETVPLNRLRTNWRDIDTYDERMRNIERLAGFELSRGRGVCDR
ncbi:MAG: hypothetical protein QM662_05250 [Gordonia sp. (in: high G+C Gram-positive bacteria)]